MSGRGPPWLFRDLVICHAFEQPRNALVTQALNDPYGWRVMTYCGHIAKRTQHFDFTTDTTYRQRTFA